MVASFTWHRRKNIHHAKHYGHLSESKLNIIESCAIRNRCIIFYLTHMYRNKHHAYNYGMSKK